MNMKQLLVLTALCCALGYHSVAAEASSRKTTLTIAGEDFHINGQPTYAGGSWKEHRIEGLLMNSRMVQAARQRLESIPPECTTTAFFCINSALSVPIRTQI